MRHIYYLAYIIYLILIISLIFFDQRKPLKRFSWILVLTFFPGLGLLLYWFIGSDSVSEYRKRIIRQRHGKILNQLNEIVAETDSLFNMPSSTGLTFHKKYCGSIYTGDNNVDIFTAGADKYKELFQDLEAAGESIHVIYFTIHRDDMGIKLIDQLIEKVKQGVEVRLLYDGVGCLATFIYPLVRKLRKAGGSVLPIRPYTRYVNYRNHRKIVIIDGRIGYLGGMNIGSQYRDGVRDKHWRDTHIRITGSAVHDLQKVFLYDWVTSVRKAGINLHHDLRRYFPAPKVKGSRGAQIVANGLFNSNAGVINLAYANLISQARKRVWLQTPYFRPSDTILNALKISAALGVDVRLMVSLSFASGGVFNRSLNRFFLRQLIGSGVKIYGYKDIMHGKTMLIDDCGLAIGTVNLNTRSLQIDDEIYGYFESRSLAEEYEDVFNRDLACCVELDRFKIEHNNLAVRAIESALSFFIPLS